MSKSENKSSRQLANEWHLPKHESFKKVIRHHAQDWFMQNGHPTHEKMNYCLDKRDNWSENILLSEVTDYINKIKVEKESQNKFFPLHKYVHHGLSSQAIVFNLIGPLITRNDFSPITELFRKKGIEISNGISQVEFEYEDSEVFNETNGQPTSIDVVLMDADNKPFVFIESKFTEAEFGGCSVFAGGDCTGKNPVHNYSSCYLHFIGRNYWKLMQEFGFDKMIETDKICSFTNYYQFFREVLFSLKKGGIFTLLHDERSPVFNYKGNGLMPFLMEFVPAEHKSKIVLISIQELVTEAELSGNHADWIGKFKTKYGIS